MSSLVLEFQQDLIKSGKSTTELLRTAKLIAAKLNLTDISDWVTAELSGFGESATLPPYRRIVGGQLQVRNPIRGWLPAGMLKINFVIRQSMAEVEELTKGEMVTMPLPHDENYPLTSDLGMVGNMNDWPQRILIPTLRMKTIASTVRDRLLDWSSELESRGITGENMTFAAAEQKSAHSQTFNIQHFTGVLGNVSNSTVQVYDYSSLHQMLRECNVPQPERNELENIMDNLKTADQKMKEPLLQRAKCWITKNAEFLGAGVSLVRKALGLGES
jgi:hypothetical protein